VLHIHRALILLTASLTASLSASLLLGCNVRASLPGLSAAPSPPAAAPSTPPAPAAGNRVDPPRDAACTGPRGTLCLAVKAVAYREPMDPEDWDPARVLDEVNRVWERCGVRFLLERFQSVDPAEQGMAFHLSEYEELDQARQAFQDPRRLLVVFTGKWRRDGSLGATGANAWTNLPGDARHGAVLEAPVAEDAELLAHELGHYLSLGHAADPERLMHHLIYSTSRELTREECAAARSSAREFWRPMVRRAGGSTHRAAEATDPASLSIPE
jgi:hypothetical protein